MYVCMYVLNNNVYIQYNINIIFIFHIDDKKIGGVLKKLALTDIKGVEEVNIFKSDGSVIHIREPKSKYLLLSHHDNHHQIFFLLLLYY